MIDCPRKSDLLSLALMVAVSVLAPSNASATDYYIDSVDGNDGWAGTTTNTAWKSHEKADSTTLVAGDIVHFKCGSSFTGAIEIAQSGTSVSPITLTSYGTGELPKFTNPSESDMNGNCIRLDGEYIIVENLHFHDTPGDSSWFASYVMRHIGAIRILRYADHCIIRNNTFTRCPQGIVSQGEYTLITSNYLDRGLNAPALWRTESSSWGPMGIHINIGNHEVSYNTIKNYGTTDSPWGSDGGAIEIDYGNYHKTNIYIHHNYSEGNAGFIESSWDYDWPQYRQEVYDWRVSFNVCYDGQSWLFMLAPCTGIYFDNNTVARYNSFGRSQNAGARMDVQGGSPVGVAAGAIFRNNLFVYTSSPYTGNRSGGALKTANWYYRKDQPGTVYGGDGNQAGSGDPQIVDLGNGNYNLMEGSPLIGAGVNLSATYTNAVDFNGVAYPASGNWDIGAMQYEGIDTPAPSSALPFADDFNALVEGDLDGQNGWTATGAAVQTHEVYEGVHAVGIDGAQSEASHLFEEGRMNVWTDLRWRPVFGVPANDPPEGSTFAFYVNTNGVVVAFDGSTPRTLENTLVSSNTWARVTVQSDHANTNWNLWVNGVSAATGLGFYSAGSGSYRELVVNGSTAGTTYMDKVSIGLSNPLSKPQGSAAGTVCYGR